MLWKTLTGSAGGLHFKTWSNPDLTIKTRQPRTTEPGGYNPLPPTDEYDGPWPRHCPCKSWAIADALYQTLPIDIRNHIRQNPSRDRLSPYDQVMKFCVPRLNLNQFAPAYPDFDAGRTWVDGHVYTTPELTYIDPAHVARPSVHCLRNGLELAIHARVRRTFPDPEDPHTFAYTCTYLQGYDLFEAVNQGIFTKCFTYPDPTTDPPPIEEADWTGPTAWQQYTYLNQPIPNVTKARASPSARDEDGIPTGTPDPDRTIKIVWTTPTYKYDTKPLTPGATRGVPYYPDPPWPPWPTLFPDDPPYESY